MTPDRWEAVCAAFEAALAVEPARRAEFLRSACPDPSVASEVERLLNQDAQASVDDFLLPPAPTVPVEGLYRQRGASLTGQKVGPYLVGERIGGGGMGDVYRATRTDEFNQVVALKVIREGADSPTAIERFKRERQVLADLAHPNIAWLLDGGTTPGGLPYFVMEFVPGLPLDDYCEARGLSTAERLRLLRTVCLAVHHAHERGVLHRDLKPSNVLVTDEGAVKVVDFGIARRLEGGAEKTIAEGLALTPSYAAPEQAEPGKELTRATDVYALGATMYALLTGRPPFRGESAHQTMRQVREEAPVPPSRVQPGLPRDAETICLKCLGKGPEQRYATARELADDLERFLNNEPIRARRASALEVAWKWAWRNPAAAALLLVCLMAALGAGVGLWWYAEQQHRRDVAELVTQLGNADINEVPGLLRQLGGERAMAEPLLLEMLASAEANPEKQRRARLGLLLWDEEQADELWPRMLEAGPDEFLVLRGALREHRGRLMERLRERLLREDEEEDEAQGEQRVFRAACALADFAPDSPRWERDAPRLAGLLCRQPVMELGQWAGAVRPVRAALIEPLKAIFRDRGRPALERNGATAALALLAAEDNQVRLSELVAEAGDRATLDFLLPYLVRPEPGPNSPAEVGPMLLLLKKGRGLLSHALPETNHDAAARRYACLGVALFRCGNPDVARLLLDDSAHPALRAQFLHALALLGARPSAVIRQLRATPSPGVRAALLLALGEYETRQLRLKQREALVSYLLGLYKDDPDAGVHGAAEWLLRRMGKEKALAQARQALEGRPRGQRRWFVNKQGQTFSIVQGPVEFVMGVDGPPEYHRRRRIDRTYALATKEVTIAEFDRFLSDCKEARSRFRPSFASQTDDRNAPVIGVTWFEAAQYCRWLSEKEGIPEAQRGYPQLAEFETFKAGKKKLKLDGDYLYLGGYRLPTEAEWEFACRAGTRTKRFFGSGDELLPKYAWFGMNPPKPAPGVAQLRPNPWGLFDIYGGAMEWCQDRQGPGALPGQAAIVDAPTGEWDRADACMLRGGGWLMPAAGARSSGGGPLRTTTGYMSGFRVARTIVSFRE